MERLCSGLGQGIKGLSGCRQGEWSAAESLTHSHTHRQHAWGDAPDHRFQEEEVRTCGGERWTPHHHGTQVSHTHPNPGLEEIHNLV